MRRALGALALILILSGCGLVQGAVEALPQGAQEALQAAADRVNSRRWSLQDPIDEFFAAVDARDAQAVKAMFSPNVQVQGEALDAAIEDLFALYPGPTEDCEMLSPVGSSQHQKYGRRTMVNVHNSFPVVCGGVNYYCSFSYVTTDEDHPENAGLKRVVLATEAAKCHPDYYRNTLDLGDGLAVVTAPAVEGETRRIGDQPYLFTPCDRTITQEDLLGFLEQETRWDAFQQRFGPPNAESYGGRYYELAPENGEARYALLFTREDGGTEYVSSAVLKDGREYGALGVIWKEEPSTE